MTENEREADVHVDVEHFCFECLALPHHILSPTLKFNLVLILV